ncbi:MAG: hypothetical protein Q7T76_14675 [Ferruginibacter sp.]|nr:hypothetical protein [Ferruginibacter sp.]
MLHEQTDVGLALPGRAMRCKSSLHYVALRAFRFYPSRISIHLLITGSRA